jgi:hypothetical protein
MLVVVTPSTVRRPRALAQAAPGRPLLRHPLAMVPRGGRPVGLVVRLLFELSLVRYVVALTPFPVAMLIWPELALPISQAPILMMGLLLFIETNVLSVPTAEKRRGLVDAAAAARGLDLMQARAREVLTRIAAGRDLADGVLHLVVEQSAMARVRPLTVVSVQREGAEPPVLELDGEERAWLAGLFDEGSGEGFGEAALQRINLAENRFQRAYALEARSVSAHARLAAMGRRLEREG